MGTIKQTVVSHPCFTKKGPQANARDIIVVDDLNESMIIYFIYLVTSTGTTNN